MLKYSIIKLRKLSLIFLRYTILWLHFSRANLRKLESTYGVNFSRLTLDMIEEAMKVSVKQRIDGFIGLVVERLVNQSREAEDAGLVD